MAQHLTVEEKTCSFGNRNQTLSRLIQVTGSLYISNGVSARNQALLSTNQITCIISASLNRAVSSAGVEYMHVPLADSPELSLLDYFDSVADKIHSVADMGGRTLVHCVAGISRSAALCLAYLMKYKAMSLLDAHTWLKSCRPIIRPNNGFWIQLIKYERQLYGRNTIEMVSTPFGDVPDIYEEEIKGMVPL